jgi:hypothetical protein
MAAQVSNLLALLFRIGCGFPFLATRIRRRECGFFDYVNGEI